MSNEPRSQADIATSLLSEAGRIDNVIGVAAQDAHADATAAVSDVLAAARQAESDMADLDKRRDLIPATGFSRLQAEVVADAESKTSDAARRLRLSLETLKDELTTAALPTVEPARESLAREETRMALGGAEGDSLVARALKIAQHGSPESVGVLFTPFFRTMMAARGVPNPDEALKSLRAVAASKVPERGRTAREIEAYAALQRVGTIEAANTAARLHLKRATRQSKG